MRATLLLAACAAAVADETSETDLARARRNAAERLAAHNRFDYAAWPCVGHCPGHEGALDVLERLHSRFVVGTRLHFHELVEFQRGRCGDDMKCVRPDQEMRALYRFLRRHPCIGLALDPVRGGRPRAQPVVFVVVRTECE